MRKIDIFNHIYPAGYYERLMKVAPDYKDIGKRMRNIPMLADLDVRFKVMDRFGEYEQVLSLPTPPIFLRRPTTGWRISCAGIPIGSPGSSPRCR